MSYRESIEKLRAEKHGFLLSVESPFNEDVKKEFKGLDYFDINEHYKFCVPLKKQPLLTKVVVATSHGDKYEFIDYATFEFTLPILSASTTISASASSPASASSLAQPIKGVLHVLKADEKDSSLFVAFTDKATNTGKSCRYVDAQEQDGMISLDFNLCYNPFHVFNTRFVSPLTPKMNHLKIPIKAGEKAWNPKQRAKEEREKSKYKQEEENTKPLRSMII